MKKRMLSAVTALMLAFVMMFSVSAVFPGGTVEVKATTPGVNDTYTVCVSSGYLALRSAMAFDSRNEIGALYNGDIVCFQSVGNSTYWYVYSPKLGKSGYVNCNYLAGATGNYTSGPSYTVSVSSGYLALRTAMAFDSRNEIGSLYNGETVYYVCPGNSTYVYVYSPKYNKCGYVNGNYLIGYNNNNSNSNSGTDYTCNQAYTVSVSSGYLALRSAMAFDSRNEIGSLYSGDTVYYVSAGNSTYVYVYSPKYNKCGYVNGNYLIGYNGGGSSSGGNTKGVACINYSAVPSGYLALRSAPSPSDSNIIYQIWQNGTELQMTGEYDGHYGYCYCPAAGMYGWVDIRFIR